MRVWSLLTQGLVAVAGAGLATILLRSEPSGSLAIGCAALWWLAVMIVVRSDLDRFIIPDGASAAISALGLVYAMAEPLRAGFGPIDAALNIAAAAAMGAGAYAVFWIVARVYARSSGREGLGFGDVKLAGASAIWLSPTDAALALEIAALGGLAVLLWRRHRAADPTMALPFGAFLAPTAWLAFVTGPILHRSMDLV